MSYNIFIADDDPEDIALFLEGLQTIIPRPNVTYRRDGEEALLALRIYTPDIIFLDLRMPRQSGTDCLKLIKADPSLSQIPVVIYAAASLPSDVEGCFRLGAARFLVKPFSYADLLEGLKLIMEMFRRGQLVASSLDQFVINSKKTDHEH